MAEKKNNIVQVGGAYYVGGPPVRRAPAAPNPTRKISNIVVKDGRFYNTRVPSRAAVGSTAFVAGTVPNRKTSKKDIPSDAGEVRRFKNKAAADRVTSISSGQETPTEEDWLAGLLGGSGGGGGGGGRIDTAAMAANRARLEALYQRLAEDIAGREAAVEQLYQTAGTNLGGIYDTSVGEINKAYDAARAAQTAQLLALGMTEQAPPQSFGSQTAATTSLQNLRAAVLAQNEASRKAAITNQRLSSEAARREGAERLAQYDAEVAQAIAAAASRGGGGGGGGGGLTPYQYATLRLREQEMGLDAERAAAELVAKQSGGSNINFQSMYNNILKQNPNMSPELAMQLAENQARYMSK